MEQAMHFEIEWVFLTVSGSALHFSREKVVTYSYQACLGYHFALNAASTDFTPYFQNLRLVCLYFENILRIGPHCPIENFPKYFQGILRQLWHTGICCFDMLVATLLCGSALTFLHAHCVPMLTLRNTYSYCAIVNPYIFSCSAWFFSTSRSLLVIFTAWRCSFICFLGD